MGDCTQTQRLRTQPSEEWIGEIRARYAVEKTLDEVMTRKLHNRRQGVEHVGSFAGLEERLNRYLRSVTGQPGLMLTNLKRLSGGASKEQFTFDLTSKDKEGRQGTRRLILRMDPAQSIVETHRLREAQILRAAAGVVPVPEVLWVDETARALGHPFLIAGFLDGSVQPRGEKKASGVGVLFPAADRETLGDQFVQHLAAIHRLDWRAHDLSTYDKPAPGTDEANRQSLALWERVWAEDTLESHPVMEYAARWLRRNMPAVERPVIVHGDYRSGNFMFTPDLRINAILDWELCHLGDFHEDLSYASLDALGARGEDGAMLASGLLPRAELFRRYEARTGQRVDPKRIFYFDVFNAYKLATICMATSLRAAHGRRTHLDAMMNLLSGIGYIFIATIERMLAGRHDAFNS